MHQIELKDSSSSEPTIINRNNATDFIDAVRDLNKQFCDGTIESIHLYSYGTIDLKESPIQIEVTASEQSSRRSVPSKCRFTTSHFIGYYGNSKVAIRILPRFGELFSYFLGYAANVFLPVGYSGSLSSENNSYWLLALLWKSLLKSALTKGQIPRSYVEERRNIRCYRGRLDIHQNIKHNLVDQSNFFCVYRKLSMDNTINRAVRHAYRLIKNKGLYSIIADLEAFDQRLESFGVKNEVGDIEELDNIRYTRINEAYRPVVKICKTIIRNESLSINNGSRKFIAYFIDVAELWELYLLRLLQRNLPSQYFVYSPNSFSGDYLLERQMRLIRPDILIEKDNRVVLIIDAKYKWYSQIGNIEHKLSVQREDLFQMCTYLYHYGKGNPINGIFTSPIAENDSELHNFVNHPNHRIGVVNIDILGCGNDRKKINEAEGVYVKKILEILNNLS